MPETQRTLFDEDITRKKIGEVQESRESFDRLAPHLSRLRAKVLLLASEKGAYGVTVKDVRDELSLPINTASGRLTELKRDGLLEKNGERRDASAVCVLTALGRTEVSNLAP